MRQEGLVGGSARRLGPGVPPLSHHPQLQNRSPPGRMPTDRGGCSFQTLPGCVIRAHFPAATGRHLFPLKRTVSMAYLWFNFCFLLHSSPQNCWKKTLRSACCLLSKWQHWPFTEARAQLPLRSACLTCPRFLSKMGHRQCQSPEPLGPPTRTWAEVARSVLPL